MTDGIEVLYEESGTDGLGPDYTTVVLIHGMGFNSGSAPLGLLPCHLDPERDQSCVPQALPLRHYRLVGLYRRGYGSSTPFIEEELQLSNSSDNEDHKKYLRQAGIHILKFLLGFATSHAIPKYTKESKTGGIVLVGWSLAAMHLSAALSCADGLAVEAYRTLEGYIHTVLYYGNSRPSSASLERYTIDLWILRDRCKRSCSRSSSPMVPNSRILTPYPRRTVEYIQIMGVWVLRAPRHPFWRFQRSRSRLSTFRQARLPLWRARRDDRRNDLDATHDDALVTINPEVLRYFTRCALFDKTTRCTTFLVQKSDLYVVPSRQVFVCTPYTNCGEGERFEGSVRREETTLYFLMNQSGHWRSSGRVWNHEI